jgi:DNA invertase Pin-like site-specific DNA recombinase
LRLGRSLKDPLGVIDAVEEKGAAFRSLVGGFDTATAHGRLVFQIFGAIAEFERELIRERTLAGLRTTLYRYVGPDGGRRRSTKHGRRKHQSLRSLAYIFSRM